MSAVASSRPRTPFRHRGLFFVGLAIAGLVLVIMLPLVFVWPRDQSEGDEIELGSVDDYRIGSVTEVVEGRFHLVRTGERTFLALLWRDPFSGCTAAWRPLHSGFLDPCHRRTYDLEGRWIGGHHGRQNLYRYPVSIVNDTVFVDTSRFVCGFSPPGEPCEVASP